MLRSAGVLAIAVAGALLAGPTAAKTIHHARFQSPTKLIQCGINIQLEGGGITCYAPYLPHTELDGYVKLRPRGRPKLGERGDSPWLPTAHTVVTLRYGQRWSGAHINCTMRRTGLTCTNLARHGFVLSKQRQRYF
jgi:hypothetical protein